MAAASALLATAVLIAALGSAPAALAQTPSSAPPSCNPKTHLTMRHFYDVADPNDPDDIGVIFTLCVGYRGHATYKLEDHDDPPPPPPASQRRPAPPPAPKCSLGQVPAWAAGSWSCVQW